MNKKELLLTANEVRKGIIVGSRMYRISLFQCHEY